MVVADAFDDETENARLRAKIYDACRTRGLSPDGKADAKAAAEQSGAMHEGRVVADAGPLDGVRKAVGASVLVRVAKDAGGLRVLVVTEGGAKEKLVKTADEALAAVTELLGGAKSSAAPAAAPMLRLSGAMTTLEPPGKLTAAQLRPLLFEILPARTRT